MKTVKDLIENEEVLKYGIEDLEDFDLDANVVYEIWAIGYDADGDLTDKEFLIDEFNDPDEAIKKAEQADISEIARQHTNVAYFSIEVETVVISDDETANAGTIYYRQVNNSYYKDDTVYFLKESSYKLLDDGSIEVPCDLLYEANKNDLIRVMFVEEENRPILTYKIISKTTANKFICEFEY
jgi:hypothetical protein